MKKIFTVIIAVGIIFSGCTKNEHDIKISQEKKAIQSVKAKSLNPLVLDEYFNEILEQIMLSIETDSISALAIIPMEDVSQSARTANIGRSISEYLQGKISENKNLKVAERSMIDKVLQELNLNMTGLLDTESAKEAGKMISVDAIICGTVTEIGIYFDINIRVIDVEKGRILSSGIAEIKKDVFIEESKLSGSETESVQAGLNALQIAIDLYGNLNVKDFAIIFPENLAQLVPEYIDRIPDPVRGSWVYDKNTGSLSHSEFPDLKPVNPRINNQTILSKLEKNKILSDLRMIRISFMNEWIEYGDYPPDMKQVIKNGLPDSKTNEWIWDGGDLSVRFYKYPLPKMYMRKDGSTEIVE